ncbi:preprotein translocase subunit SECE1 [Mangifera indica]|uniref:preprotein translocase subunit SECE1 n=1 Tax=Mangifera indica TaxID=29780 RepID=UPI001CFB2381|nr:preprotein translocase subunit SECE1 [Mangifera indica]
MAVSLQFPVAYIPSKTSVRPQRPHFTHPISFLPKATNIRAFRKKGSVVVKAIEESQESTKKSEASSDAETETVKSAGESSVELSELGSEIKKVLQERKEEKEGDLLNGVAEEIREIEWPAFGKVLGTTGVVLGVIAGSSVVLLTVNFVLAELSDRVFAGRGVQDFLG